MVLRDAALPPVRMPRELLDAARQVAVSRDETLSQVVRRALREYVATSPGESSTFADIGVTAR